MIKCKTLDEAQALENISYIYKVSDVLVVAFEPEDTLPFFLTDGVSDEARTSQMKADKAAWIASVSAK